MADELVFDVTIVGGGLAGSTLAVALGDTPLRIALVEQKPPPKGSDPERVIALSHGSVQFLEAIGLGEVLSGLKAEPIRIIHVEDEYITPSVRMDCRKAGLAAFGYVVDIQLLGRLLQEHRPPNLTLFQPARLTDLSREEGWIRLRVDGISREIRTRLVVGADGSRSAVRRMAGIRCLGWPHNRFGIVASINTERPHAGWAFECFRKDGPLALLPLSPEKITIVWSLAPRRAMEMLRCGDEAFLLALKEEAGTQVQDRLGAFISVGQRACFPFELRLARRCAADRIVLIGNAAHTIHPVAGQGMNLGLRDVRALSDILHQSVKEGRDPGAHVHMGAFADARRMDNIAVIGFTEGLDLAFSNRFAPLALARRLGLQAMARSASLQQGLIRQAAGLWEVAS